MTNIETVFFLGAGASASEGAPMQNQLIREIIIGCAFGEHNDIIKTDLAALDLLSNDYLNNLVVDGDETVLGMMIANPLTLIDFFKDFWEIDLLSSTIPENEIFPTLEECLGVLDLALLNSKSYKKYSLTSLKQIREYIVYLIAIVLENKLMLSGSPNHERILEKIEAKKLKKSAFVSFNYDILIDNAIMRFLNQGDSNKNLIPIDYGINLKLSSSRYKFRKNGIKLLKVHGSLNWLYCRTCNEITLTPFEKSVSTIIKPKKKCKNCQSRFSPIIIPPTYYKDMSNVYLQNIYWEIDRILRSAKEIYFCGYSFPDADMHIKYLFKRMEMNSTKSPKIFIINFHEEKKKKWDSNENIDSIKTEFVRIQRFLGRKSSVYYTKISFNDFLKKDIKKIDFITYKNILDKEAHAKKILLKDYKMRFNE